MRKLLTTVLAAGLLLAGCAPRKQTYQQPASPAPQAWSSGEAAPAGTAPQPADLKWDAYFSEPRLRQVIQLALDHNRDLRISALNVERVQEQYRIQSVQRRPTVSAAASVDAYRMPADMTNNDKSYIVNSNRVGVQVSSWELDFFGRIRALKSQALEQFLASQQGRVSTQMSLLAAVAASYLELAADQDGLRLAQSTLEAQLATLDLIRRTRDLGIKSDLEVSQAQSQVDAARVDIVRYTAQLTLDRNTLNLLAGTTVPEDLLPTGLSPDPLMQEISAGVPSEVLLRRPDILLAEHQLKAAYANIEAARANFFPRIALTAGGGLMSGALSQLFSFRALTWQFAPQVSLPIFDSGVRQSTHRIAQIDRDTAVATYEKAIQTAFREVSDSLSQRSRLLEQQQAQQVLVNTLNETYRLTEARYKIGVDNYLNVLVAQRALYSGQQALLSLRLARLDNLVMLYKVLGGGA